MFVGRARDVVTNDADSAPVVMAEEQTRTIVTGRDILHVESIPARVELAGLAGTRAGNSFRLAVDRAIPDERLSGSPLYLLLDDLAGATLVASWTVGRWSPIETAPRTEAEAAERLLRVENICTGFRTGSSALGDRGRVRIPVNASPNVELTRLADPDGWHPLSSSEGMQFRRARWIDIWREDDDIVVEAGFQDSGTTPAHGRLTVHEYAITARADASGRTLRSIAATPSSSLPFAACFAAPANLHRLIGTSVAELRTAVPALLARSAGCTHLNDAIRAVADVPLLARSLPR